MISACIRINSGQKYDDIYFIKNFRQLDTVISEVKTGDRLNINPLGLLEIVKIKKEAVTDYFDPSVTYEEAHIFCKWHSDYIVGGR